jgi:hypothetical protein
VNAVLNLQALAPQSELVGIFESSCSSVNGTDVLMSSCS